MNTKEKLIELMFVELYMYGYQGAKLNKIVEKSELTKGAMYHYFKSKKELALLTIEDIFFNFIHNYWEIPLKNSSTPIKVLIELMYKLPNAKIKDNYIFDFKIGCPLNNLIQEMAHIDEDFAILLKKIFKEWQKVISLALTNAQQNSIINKNLIIEDISAFIIASLEGSIMIGKINNSKDDYFKSIKQLEFYLQSLKF